MFALKYKLFELTEKLPLKSVLNEDQEAASNPEEVAEDLVGNKNADEKSAEEQPQDDKDKDKELPKATEEAPSEKVEATEEQSK